MKEVEKGPKFEGETFKVLVREVARYINMEWFIIGLDKVTEPGDFIPKRKGTL